MGSEFWGNGVRNSAWGCCGYAFRWHGVGDYRWGLQL